MTAHQTSTSLTALLEAEVNKLTSAGYPQNEIEAFAKGYKRARGLHPHKYVAGWSRLDAQRKVNNRST